MSGPAVAAIVVTNHNYEAYVAEAVNSALAQTVRCDVIVVDDGSTDNSVQVLTELAAAHPGLRVVLKENGGQGSAINAGWAEVTAPVVLFLDGDDRLGPTAVEQTVAALAADDHAVRCQHRLSWIDGNGHPVNGQFPEPGRRLPAGDLLPALTSNPDDIPWQPTSGNAFTAEVLARLLPMPEPGYRISADHYLSNLSALYGTVVAVEQTLGDYRVHGDNADHRGRFDLERVRSILRRTEETREHLIAHGERLGLAAMPERTDGFRSVTTAGLRLVSYRFGSRGGSAGDHPFPTDRLVPLVRQGVEAAITRPDFSVTRKLGAVAWFAAVAVAPRRLIPAIAGRALQR